MPTWVKVLTVLATLPMWMAVVIVDLVHGVTPSPELMAVPAGVIFATSGRDLLGFGKRASEESDDKR
jgi:hypothetical protein